MPESKKVVVLGASGYLGRKACDQLNEAGITTFHCSRRLIQSEMEFQTAGLILDFAFPTLKITRKIEKLYLENLFHNLQVSQNLGLRYIYMGSYSSNHRSTSKYGYLKRKAENLVLEMKGTVLRIGLVIDYDCPGGRFKQFLQINNALPFVLQFPESWCPIMVTSSGDFERALIDLVKADHIFDTHEIGLPAWLNDLTLDTMKTKRHVRLNENTLILVSYLLKYIPVGKLDFIRSVLYKEERFR